MEKTGRKSIFIRIDSNLTGLERRFTTVIQAGNYYNTITKLLQKREMRKDIVIELSYKGFSRASDYS